MGHRWAGIVATLGFVPLAAAQLPPPPPPADQDNPPKPKLFVVERIKEFGVIVEGDKSPITWLLENHGNANLVIDRAKGSCGCTVVKLSDKDKVIPPGGSLELKAIFDSSRRRGDQSKNVTVYSNDPAEPELKLEFRGTVETLFETSPATVVNLRIVQRGRAAGQTLDILPGKTRRQAKVVSVEFRNGLTLKTTSEPLEVDQKKAQRVRFTVPGDAPLGIFTSKAVVTVNVDGIERDRLLIFRGEVIADLTWHPKIVNATKQESIRGKQFTPVMLKTPNRIPFDVLGASAGPVLDVKVEPAKRSGPRIEYLIYLTVRDDAPSGPFGAQLKVHTSSLDQPVITVPVFGIVAPRIKVDPPVILFRTDGTKAGTQRRVKLQASPEQTLDISDIRCEDPSVTAQIDWEASKRYHHLRYLNVRYQGPPVSKPRKTVLEVATNVPGAETLHIDVTIKGIP